MKKNMDKKKKKVKIERKAPKSKEPLMTGHEAILVYKTNIMEEKLRDMKLQERAWEEKNERHIAQNNKLKSEQNILMERLLEQFRSAEKTWENEEIVEKTAVVETLQEKWSYSESKESGLQEIKMQIAEVEKEIEALTKNIDYWTSYQEKDHFCHKTYINVLKQQIADMNTCFSYLHGFLTEKLIEDKETIQQDMTNKLNDHRIEASELAISQLPKQCKQEVQDNEWLKQEVAHQQKEFQNLYNKTSELELANLQTMDRLFERKTNDLKIVRNLFLKQCGDFDDMRISPGILEMDLSKLYDTSPQYPSLSPSLDATENSHRTTFLTQEDPLELMKLGPIEWKLLAVCGKPAPLHMPEQKSEQELNALKRYPSDWPVTKLMLRCLKSTVPK